MTRCTSHFSQRRRQLPSPQLAPSNLFTAALTDFAGADPPSPAPMFYLTHWGAKVMTLVPRTAAAVRLKFYSRPTCGPCITPSNRYAMTPSFLFNLLRPMSARSPDFNIYNFIRQMAAI